MMEWPTLVRYYTAVDRCSCPDWRFRGQIRPCKHIKALRDALALIDATRRKWDTLNVDNRKGV